MAIPCAEPGRLLRCVTQHPAHLLSVQAGSATGSRGGSKKWRDAVCAPVAFGFKLLPAEGQGDAGSNVIAECHGAHELCPADAKLLAGSKSGRYNATTPVGVRRRGGNVRLFLVSQQPHW